MWVNPNWSGPPLRIYIPVFTILIFRLGRCQGQGQAQRIPPPQPGFQPGGFPPPPGLPPGRFGPQNPPPPFLQPGQAAFQPLPPPQQQPQQFQSLPQQLPAGLPHGSSFNDPRTPDAPVQLSSIVNLGSDLNGNDRSMYRTWRSMSRILRTLQSQNPDYILSLQPGLVRGIPSFNITLALREPLNPQVLKALVTHSTGMLVSQKAYIVGKLGSRLGDSNVIHMILGTESPAELIAFLNPRLLRRNMPVFIRAISEFTSSRFEPNLLKVRLLPTNFLSIMLTTLNGDKPLSLQSLSSRSFGNGDLISSSLMGINCQQVKNLRHEEVIPILEIFRNQLYGTRKIVKNLNFPTSLRNCGLEAVGAHLGMKTGDNGTNLLSRLDPREIESIGGEIFTGVPLEGLQSLPVEIRRQILIEIGQVEMFDLVFLVPLSTLQWYGKALLSDLTVMSTPATIPPQPETGTGTPPLPLPPVTPSTQFLDIQSLRKLGNLFCYADILKTNASKEPIRQLLTTKMTVGAKTCCLDPTGQLEWATALKKTFGSDPSQWKGEELGLVGDLLVALPEEDIGKISVKEIGKVIPQLLRTSGLNFPVNLPGTHGPLSFAHACSNLLEDTSEFLKSFKALMRKYVLGAELLVDGMQKAQRVDSDQATPRRTARAVPDWNEYNNRGSSQFRRQFPEQNYVRYARSIYQGNQRYRRQAPTVMVPPPLVQVNAAPPPQVQPTRPVPVPMIQPQAPTRQSPVPMGTAPPSQRLPPTAASQRMRPVPPPSAPPQPMRIQQVAPPPRVPQPQAFPQPQPFPAQQVPIQMQRLPPLMVPIPGPQSSGMSAPQRQQQQGPIRTQGPPPPPPAANATAMPTDERQRSLPSDPEVKLTCLGVTAAGPTAIGLQISDFESLEPDDLRNCIEAIGFVDWDEEMKRELLLLLKQKLNLTSQQSISTLNLIELGNLVTAFSTSGQTSNGLFSPGEAVQIQDKFHPFDISSIDFTVPNALDSISILGSRIKNPEMLKAIGEKFSQDNGLFKPKPGSSNAAGVRATVWSLGNIICGLQESVLRTIFDTSPTLFLEVSPMLGSLEGCGPETLATLAHYAIQNSNYGDPAKWTPEDVATLGVVVAGLTPESRASIPPLSMEGVHPLAVKALSSLPAPSLTPSDPHPNPDAPEDIIAEPTNEHGGDLEVRGLPENGTTPTPPKPSNATTNSTTTTPTEHPSTNLTVHHERKESSEMEVADPPPPTRVLFRADSDQVHDFCLSDCYTRRDDGEPPLVIRKYC